MHKKMGMMKFQWLVLMLILVSVGKWCCEGCWKEERDGLLRLKALLSYPLHLTDWIDGTDCCQWEGVECNTTTSRVAELRVGYTITPYGYMWGLRGNGYNWYLNFSDFQVFEDLKNLSLVGINIDGCLQNPGSWELKNLRLLNLGDNYLNDTSILSCLSGLPSLNSLYLWGNQLTGKSAYVFSGLKNLRVLHLSFNYLDQLAGKSDNKKLQWPENLEELDLYGNYLKNDILLSFTEHHCLKSIDLGENCLEGSLNITGLRALSKLETLILNWNNITKLSVPQGGNQSLGLSLQGFSWSTSLGDLQLAENNFSNDIVSSLSGLQNLKSLDLRGNHLEGLLDISGLNALGKLKKLDLSGNNIVNLSLNALSKLETLDLSRNNIINLSLNALSKLETLDLSQNNIVNLCVHQGLLGIKNLSSLKLDGNNIDGSMLRESLQAFSSMRSLSLSENKFNGTIVAKDFGDLNNLEELVLDYSSNIGIEFFNTIGALNSLRVLSMADSGINGTLPEADWSELNKLEELDLSINKFEGPLPSSFSNMTSLQNLHLSDNYFTGNIASTLTSLTSLESLDFEENQFEVPVSFTSLANHSYIKFIYGGGNKFVPDPDSTTHPWIPKFQLKGLVLSSTTQNHSLPLSNFLFYQYNLTFLDFEGWKLDEEFPSWLLANNTKMTHLVLRNCSITGHLQLPSHPNIYWIDMSDNSIIGIIISKNNSSNFPNLQYLNMARNKIYGSFPHSLFYTQIRTLDIGSNNFGGKLPKSIANASYLIELHMDNNQFEDSIPTEFVEHQTLSYLDLSGNKLSGFIPSFLNTSITFIRLSSNRLRGFSTRMFNEKTSLVLLDLSYNGIASNLQYLLSNCTKLDILLLKGNYFTGQISEQLCQLTNLQIMDLSHNLLSGPIPKCLGKINFVDKGLRFYLLRLFGGKVHFNRGGGYSYSFKLELEANFTTKGTSYTYEWTILELMTGMDLSQNKLDGNIPSELGNLTQIRAINMSHNHLIGKIPGTFSNLKQIESLDLSFNRLNGTIPPQLIELTSLEVFSVAYNNISGPTPEMKAQFLTFGESCYEGNPFICGPPLPRNCTDHIEGPSSVPNALNGKGDNDGFLDMQVFYASFAVTYMMVLLVMAIVLYINPYWRQTWFYFIELVIRNCYYFFVDLFYKLYYFCVDLFYKLPIVRNM